MDENAMRAAIVAEARTWLRTPWHHEARVKGAGVDCAQLLIGVYSAVGLVPAIEVEHYPPDWHLHRGEQRFLRWLEKFADKTDEARPGDIAMFRFARAAAHGGIVIEWPLIVHAFINTGFVELCDASRGELAGRLAGFWRLKAFADNETARAAGEVRATD